MINLNKYIIFIVAIVLFSGCITHKNTTIQLNNVEWKTPEKPKKYPVEFKRNGDSLYLTKENASNLLKNIEEKDAYIEKMDLLVEEMKKYYKAK